ncbi:hypothetical protein [Aeoliella sp.]|uniref:hypothetical protein n=1 Tax=Aeoliella sp. TaxID=2795800 RepID=UPI003CCC16D9
MNSWFDWRPPRGGIALLAGCFVIAAIIFIVAGGHSWYTRYFVPLFLPIGIGLWLKHSWARWITFTFFALVALIWLVSVFAGQFSMRRALQGLAIASSLLALWEWDVWPEDHAAAYDLDYDKFDEEDYDDEDYETEDYDAEEMAEDIDRTSIDSLRYHDEA